MSKKLNVTLPELNIPQDLPGGLSDSLRTIDGALKLKGHLRKIAETATDRDGAELAKQIASLESLAKYYALRDDMTAAYCRIEDDRRAQREALKQAVLKNLLAGSNCQEAIEQHQEIVARAALLDREINDKKSEHEQRVCKAKAAFDEAMSTADEDRQQHFAEGLHKARIEQKSALESIEPKKLRLSSYKEAEARAQEAIDQAQKECMAAQDEVHEARRELALIDSDERQLEALIAYINVLVENTRCASPRADLVIYILKFWFSCARRALRQGSGNFIPGTHPAGPGFVDIETISRWVAEAQTPDLTPFFPDVTGRHTSQNCVA